ncbi:MAG: ATP-dependent helicase MrfA [Calditrichia bacterium]
MNLEQLISWLKNHHYFSKNVTHWETIPARQATYVDFPGDIEPKLLDALDVRGIHQLYSHQREAYEAITSGEHIGLVTPTASGKTLSYNLPILNNLLKNPSDRAMYLFPTKALAQDQLKELYALIELMEAPIKTYTFDGDTPVQARKAIREAGQIIITNPDMLHQGILPHHTIWIKLFETLKYVVIDEIHSYRGVFGSHLANVIRRLKRIARFYGNEIQFICCSATIGNPKELIEKIIEEPVTIIDKNGAPSGEKHFVLYNPPVVNWQLGIRRGVVGEARKLGELFLDAGVQSIIFARSRMKVEIIATYLKNYAKKKFNNGGIVRGYRGGYLPSERRTIEEGIKQNKIKTVVSTNALELGIDIGSLDVSILAGYPGSIASTWQQSGRAGRKNSTAISILIASSSPLDQFLIHHPEYILGIKAEDVQIDPNNLTILLNHIKCGAFELSFQPNESFGIDNISDILDFLVEERILKKGDDGKYYWMREIYPAEEVSLRTASPDNVVIVDKTYQERVIGEVDLLSAPELVHKDAIYIHEGQQYHVDDLDWPRKKAYVKQVDVDYFTDAITKTSIKILVQDENEEKEYFGINWGEINVSTVVTGYKKIKLYTHENVGAGRVFLPEMEMATESFWIHFYPAFLEKLEMSEDQLSAALKGIGFNLRNIVPLFILCDVNDIRSVPMVRSPYTQWPTLFIYDNLPGGIGLSRKILNNYKDILNSSLESIKNCSCQYGCPSCIGPSLDDDEMEKASAITLLRHFLQLVG